MKHLAAALIYLLAATAFAEEQAPDPDKPRGASIPAAPLDGAPATARSGGETIDDATLIPGLPYYESGNTTSYADDYNAVCPYTAIGGHDVVYKYIPTVEQAVTISICNSWFDTKLYVFEDSADNVIACNDDWCGPDDDHYGVTWMSYLENLPVHAGHVYYIVIDGYTSCPLGCGVYTLHVTDRSMPVACDHTCPPDGMPEGEPECYDGYIDHFNGGCSSNPPVFSQLACGSDPLRICGGGGVYRSGTRRDTDWYAFTLTEPKAVTFRACGNFPIFAILMSIESDCSATTILGDAVYSHKELVLSRTLTSGDYVFEIGSSSWNFVYGCAGALYQFEVEGLCPPPTSALETSWGSVKKLFR
jgi:hypothetical protein